MITISGFNFTPKLNINIIQILLNKMKNLSDCYNDILIK